MHLSKKSGICLMGLTGSGKTALAMSLYDALDAEIISVDSAMIYRGMDIGSAKPEKAELEKYPHHLVDICEPSERYSAAKFVSDVSEIIDDCHGRQRLPILVGGTMLYFKALQQGLNQLPETTEAVRIKINQLKETHGLAYLYKQLQSCDPQMAEKLNQHDAQRIQRALEVFETTGKSMTSYLQSQQQCSAYDFLNLALVPSDRKWLHAQLAKRFDIMLEQGFEQEVRQLMQLGVDGQMPAMRCVGYKQMLSYLNGEIDVIQMKDTAIAATRQLAKRQHTWLRKWPEVTLYEPQQIDLFECVLQQISHFIRAKS